MYGLIHLGFIGFGDLGDHGSVRRIHIRELPRPGHETAVDIILD
jgi:hypothetical protein